jgi:hypothetical protein
LTGDEEDAREVCQEAMMKIYKYLGKYQAGKRMVVGVSKLNGGDQALILILQGMVIE